MNLSAQFLCEFFQKPMLDAAPYWDYIFGNETEALAFAETNKLGVTNLREIALIMQRSPKINKQRERVVVFTQGHEPTLVCTDGMIAEFPVPPLSPFEIIDTNCAGDAFVGGFLSQLALGRTLPLCIECGHSAAAFIIQQSGCTLVGQPKFRH